MALYLLYRSRPEDRLPNGVHSLIVSAADVSTARAVAAVPATWSALDLSGVADGSVIKIEGDAIGLLGISRGGNRTA